MRTLAGLRSHSDRTLFLRPGRETGDGAQHAARLLRVTAHRVGGIDVAQAGRVLHGFLVEVDLVRGRDVGPGLGSGSGLGLGSLVEVDLIVLDDVPAG